VWDIILRVFLFSATLSIAAFYLVAFCFSLGKRKTRPHAHQPKVSVVIPAYNEEGVINNLLKDIRNSSYPIAETIVIDDNSSDSTLETARNLNAVSIRNETTLGKAASLNKGARMAQGDVIVVFDADNRPQNDCIKRLLEHFDSKEVGMATGVSKIRSQGFVSRLAALEFSLCFYVFQPFSARLNFLLILHGAFFAIKRDLAFFDEEALTEDFEISIAMSSKGYKMEFEPEAISHVSAPPSFSLFAHQRERWIRGAVQTWLEEKNSLKKAFPRIRSLGLFLKALEHCFPLIWASNLTLFLLCHFFGEYLLMYVAFFSLIALTVIACFANFRARNNATDILALPFLSYFYLLFVVWYFLKALVLEYLGHEPKFSKIPHKRV